MGYGSWPTPPPDPTTTATVIVRVGPPPETWDEREAVVETLLTSLTEGQKASLYRKLYERELLRLDRCRFLEDKERDQLKPKAAKRWP